MKKFILPVLCFTLLVSAAFFVNGCQKKHEHSDVGNKPENNISFRTLSVGEKNIDGNIPVYGKVPNVQTKFSFIDEVTTTGNIQYIVSLDIYGIQQVATKTIPLTEGDNVVYITEQLNGNPKAVYEVTIRRRKIYTVTFNPQGGSAVESQKIEEDSLIIEPTTIKTGYSFTGWNYDFTQPITEDTTITAAWTANTNTAYKVEYYLENLEDNNYTLIETENSQGTTDTTATAEIKTYDHFTFYKNNSISSGNVSGDGSLVLKVYYTRNTYTLSNANTSYGEITNATTKKYGNDKIDSVVTEYLGCEFLGWYNGEELLSTAKEYTFTIVNNVTAKFKEKDEMSNFNFYSSVDTCNITGVKNKTVSEIIIPDYVTSIGDSAFRGCNNLNYNEYDNGYYLGNSNNPYVTLIKAKNTSISSCIINENTKIICPSAFSGCRSLTSVTIPSSVTSIGNYAFQDCDNLKYNEYDNGYYLGNSNNPCVAFVKAKNTSISSCIINENAKIICSLAFGDCSRLTSVTIPNSVTSIGSDAFNVCRGLTSVTIGNGVTSIGDGAFSGCSGLTSVNIPNSVTSIGDYAFSVCSGLTSITIPNGVTSIGKDAFAFCSGLKSITIGNGVTSISDSAFAYCSSLTSVTIPNSVTSIGEYAFYCCDNLNYNEYDNGYYLGNSNNPYVALIKAKNTSISSCIINKNTKIIYSSAFVNCSGLTSVIWNAENCTKAGSNNNPIFYDCSKLTNVTIGKNVKTIPSYAFYGCSGLTSITIPNSVTSIGDCAFENCNRLTSITIPDCVTSIGSSAFYNCSGLTSVTIPDSVTSIGSWAFSDCSGLTSVTIGSGVTSIGNSAFENCSGLTSVTIGNGVTSIGRSAFSDCSGLTSVTIPDGVTSIDDRAFFNCSSLASVTIGCSVTSIGYQAFYNCSGLKTVLYKGTAEQWNNISIGGNSYLTNASRYYYSETEPALNSDGTAYAGNYWHYDTDGVTPVIWKKEN